MEPCGAVCAAFCAAGGWLGLVKIKVATRARHPAVIAGVIQFGAAANNIMMKLRLIVVIAMHFARGGMTPCRDHAARGGPHLG